MITPAYSLTATERVLPRLALDFTTASLDSRVSITRALNTSTRVNSSGYIEVVNANLPRFDYNPVTKICRGLLIEESRENLLLNSAGLGTGAGAWSGAGVSGTLTYNSTDYVAPDNTNTFMKYVSIGDEYYQQTKPTTAGTVYTFSFLVKSTTNSKIAIEVYEVTPAVDRIVTFNTSNQTFSSASNFTSYNYVDFGNGVYRIYATFTATGSTSSLFRLRPTEAGTFYLWGAQNEIGSFPTSFIYTTTASVTRNADTVSMTGTNFSDWYNASEGTIVAAFQIPVATGATRRAVSINDGTTNDTIQIALVNTNNQGYVEIRDNLSIQVTATVGSVFTVGTPVKMSLAYKANSFAYAAFGQATGTDTSGTVPTVSQMEIGSQLGAYMNGWMSKIYYYPLRLTNAEVSAISK